MKYKSPPSLPRRLLTFYYFFTTTTVWLLRRRKMSPHPYIDWVDFKTYPMYWRAWGQGRKCMRVRVIMCMHAFTWERKREQFILYCSWRAISKLINQKLVAFRLLADSSSSPTKRLHSPIHGTHFKPCRLILNGGIWRWTRCVHVVPSNVATNPPSTPHLASQIGAVVIICEITIIVKVWWSPLKKKRDKYL